MDERGVSRPALIAAALALAGIAGGVTVFLVGSRIHESDREAFRTWEAGTQTAIARARGAHASLPALRERLESGGDAAQVRRALTEMRIRLERAREQILAATRAPILQPTTALYLEGIAQSLAAVSALQDAAVRSARARAASIARYEEAYAVAEGRFTDAAAAHERLRARLRLEPEDRALRRTT